MHKLKNLQLGEDLKVKSERIRQTNHKTKALETDNIDTKTNNLAEKNDQK